MRAVLKAEIDSGRLVAAMSGGESLSINPDGSVGYVKTDPGPEPVLFPEDRKLLDTVNASPDDFDAEAEALELGAGAARPLSHEQFLEGERAASTKVAAAARERAAAEGAASEADRQASDANERTNALAKAELESWNKATAAREAGDRAGAAEATESAQGLHVRVISAKLEAEQACAARPWPDFGRRACRDAAAIRIGADRGSPWGEALRRRHRRPGGTGRAVPLGRVRTP